MNFRRRDLLLAAGLTIVFGTSSSARVLVEGGTGTLDQPVSAPRRLSLRHAHTGETFSGPFRDTVGPLPDAMIDLSWFLRDFHDEVRGPLFVETLDFLADVIQESGRPSATILSAYRTKKTNDRLAARIYGVAEKSQHIAGRAIDITLDARLETAAGVARSMSRGGVGWYPRSHFIHLDSGPVRSWTIDIAEGDRKDAARRGTTIVPGGDINLTPSRLKRPLTVSERLRLQRAIARKQSRKP